MILSPLPADPSAPPFGKGPIRVGFVGAGYIADWHAEALRRVPGAVLAGVHDADPDAAARLADGRGVPAFESLADLSAACDAVHVLTPPSTHEALALEALGLGLHVLVEKPFALSAAGARRLAEAAAAAGRQVGVSHNFLGLPGWTALRAHLDRGAIGRPLDLRVDWALPFAPLQSGPFGLWPLRETANLLWEIGPHPVGLAVDLFGPLDLLHVETGQTILVPGAGPRPQSIRLLARAGHVEVTIALSLAQTHEERALALRGTAGLVRLDYGRDRLVLSRDNASDLIVNPLRRGLSLATQEAGASLRLAAREVVSLNRRSPYALSFRETLRAFYGGLRTGQPDRRFGAAAAVAVCAAIEAAAERLPAAPAPRPPRGVSAPPPRIAVIGGTGFIGRALVRALAARGERVRVLSRGRAGPFADLPQVEVVSASLSDEEALVRALDGMDAVVNLARSTETTWEAALAGEVATTLRIGRAAHRAGTGRLVHTGTIASYDLSDPRATITEDTPFGPMRGRNLYARAKAEGEARLLALAAETGLALAIARPGIVVGPEGPLQHWGLGRWHGAGAVRLWNSGDTILPFVLVDDVAEGLILMTRHPEAPGRSFNLVGEPMLSARDWFEEIARRTGGRIRVAPGSPWVFWAAGAAKALLKAGLLRRRTVEIASLADWRSRAHLARFLNTRPKAWLGWRPEADRETFLHRAIDRANLFGA
ncbi:NAD-dependent epimerase/dehydratase family protein [Rubellimicrobium sp. CFH 75288]|uniref:NAD-dependent epimerase/dehydratase family protein n=1 Tax=Rubellimicrobium sp. CFH 75288 TaxID=2697034 RepID=UPI0014133D8D|nr:NAD-dependent epimerase/dehydratase family protein [Rubellimicrobium sp. CFH 75288]NAZ38097.1 NAD-dependent epimerase/dehydratase family protein [Rubellimicrobium sp. CFH 75288]